MCPQILSGAKRAPVDALLVRDLLKAMKWSPVFNRSPHFFPLPAAIDVYVYRFYGIAHMVVMAQTASIDFRFAAKARFFAQN